MGQKLISELYNFFIRTTLRGYHCMTNEEFIGENVDQIELNKNFQIRLPYTTICQFDANQIMPANELNQRPESPNTRPFSVVSSLIELTKANLTV